MSLRSPRRAVTRALAFTVSALLAAGSLSLASATAATAAETDSRVTVPIVGLGEVSVSKTKNLVDGESITVSGRFIAQSMVERYLIDQVGTNYSPADGGENGILVHEGNAVLGDVTTDPDDPAFQRFETSFAVHRTLTSRTDGTVFDGGTHQSYLVLGGGWVQLTAPGGSTYLASVIQKTNSPLFSSNLVPLTFEGGAANLTVDTPVSVTEQPESVTTAVGEAVTFTAAAAGDPAPALQWQVSEDNGESWTAVSGETSGTLTRRVGLTDDGLQYRLRVDNRVSRAYSDAAVLSVTPAPPAPYDPGAFSMVTEGAGGRVTPLSGLVDGQRISIDARYYSVSGNDMTYEPLALGQLGAGPVRPAIITPTRDGDAYVATGEYPVARHLTNSDGSTTDCVITQCYLIVGGTVMTPNLATYITDPARASEGVIQPVEAPIADTLYSHYFPIYFEGSELVPPTPPTQTAPVFTAQPDDVTVAAGYAAQFETVASGEPAPAYQWQRSLDRGQTWQTIRGQNAESIRIPTTETLTGSKYRVRAVNVAGTAYSDAATLTVTPGSTEGNNPGADVTRKGISLDWIGSPELQRRTPAYTPSYYSAGVSEGNKPTYKNTEGNATIVFRPKDGTPERATTYESIFAHLPKMPADPPSGNLQLVRLNNGLVERNDDGGGTVRWNATWSINFYGGLVPFTLRNPVLTWNAHGTGTLTADLLGYGSSMDNPDIKFPLEPVLGATISTFSNATISDAGVFSATPDYAGVTVETASSAATQDRTVAGWGSWPQAFVDFQFKTGLSSYWYSSGGPADQYKAPSPITIAGLTGFSITPAVPGAPGAPTVAAVSGTELAVSWEKPATGEPTGYTVTATHGGTVKTVTVDGATLSAAVAGLELGTEYAVTVTATNKGGASPASAATPARTHGVPDAPAAPVVKGTGDESVVVTWTASARDGGSPITGYRVSLAGPDGVTVVSASGEATSVEIGDLGFGTYTASVVAITAVGSSEPSAASGVVKVVGAQPTAPPELAGESLFDQPSAGAIDAVVSGSTVTISVPEREGEWVGVSIHSEPTFLGWHRVTDGVVTVSVPAGFTGTHHFVVYAADGSVIGYDAVDIAVAVDGAVLAPVDPKGKVSGGLASTGSDVNPLWSVLALALLLGGAGTLAVARRPRRG